MKVIIADDDRITRSVLREILERGGHEVCGEAGNGTEALILCTTQHPDAVFLDVNMPAMNGFDALQQLRTADPELAVVMISSSSTLENVRLAARLRVQGFIVKPFAAEKVLNALRAVVARAH